MSSYEERPMPRSPAGACSAVAGTACPSEPILAVVRLHVQDPAFLALLGEVLKSIDFRDADGCHPLASVLTRITLYNIDQVLQQANSLGRQGSFIHAACIRFDRDVALFLDNDPQYDWLLPAVQKRLREALAEIQAEVDPEKTQLVDLARGEKLHFLDHKFAWSRIGTARPTFGTRACRSLLLQSPSRQNGTGEAGNFLPRAGGAAYRARSPKCRRRLCPAAVSACLL
jgi:hypothetical protein